MTIVCRLLEDDAFRIDGGAVHRQRGCVSLCTLCCHSHGCLAQPGCGWDTGGVPAELSTKDARNADVFCNAPCCMPGVVPRSWAVVQNAGNKYRVLASGRPGQISADSHGHARSRHTSCSISWLIAALSRSIIVDCVPLPSYMRRHCIEKRLKRLSGIVPEVYMTVEDEPGPSAENRVGTIHH